MSLTPPLPGMPTASLTPCGARPVPGALRIEELGALTAPHAEALAELLIDCVAGGASVGFLWPLSRERALRFWNEVGASLVHGERRLLVAHGAAGALLGTVQVLLAAPDNQPHRGDLAKMLVARGARRCGVGAALLGAAERLAAGAGKRLLVLDTVTGSDGERLYARHGWQRCGVIPDYALWPDGRLCATTVFYKALAAP